MSKAEERALETFPVLTTKGKYGCPVDWNEPKREAYQHGYEMAEEDLALTWEDVLSIINIGNHLMETEKDLTLRELGEKVVESLKNRRGQKITFDSGRKVYEVVDIKLGPGGLISFGVKNDSGELEWYETTKKNDEI